MEALSQLAIVWAGTFVAIVVARATRFTAVIYYLAVGAILVNVGWLPEEVDPFIQGFAGVGIMIIMFALGFEENTSAFIQSVKRSWGIVFFGGLAPFLTAFWLAYWFWDDRQVALMVGLAMTATAVSLTMVSLRSEGLQSSQAARRIMTSAVLDAIAPLALVAVLVPFATGSGDAGITEIGLMVGKALLFFLVVTFAGALVFPDSLKGWQSRAPLLGRYGIKNVLAFSNGQFSTVTALMVAVTISMVAHGFGFHFAVGAFMAGLILKKEYFRSDAINGSYADTKRFIDGLAFTWVGPVFFVVLGAKLVFDWDIIVSVIPHTTVMVIGIVVAQVASAALAARYTGGLRMPAAMMVGFGMLGRAELAFVVMDIAYVEHSVFSAEAFYTLMLTAFCLNVAVQISIRLWKPFYEETARERPALHQVLETETG